MKDAKKLVVVSEVKGGDLAEKLAESLQKIGFKGKGKVLIKPNMCMPKYVPGAVTNPQVIYHLVRLLRRTAEEVMVGESDGYNYSCDTAFEKTGIKKAVEKAGGRILNLSTDKLVKVNFRESKVSVLFLPKTLFEVDSIINVPVMKTHEFTLYSGAVKNLFGLIPDRKRIFLHPCIEDVLFNLCQLTKPITIMDAITAMEKNGPTRGSPVKMGLILTSKCPVALDIVATEIMGIDWREVSYLRYIFQKTGFYRQDIEVVGCKAEHFHKFVLPTIDAPVKVQWAVFEHAFLTKLLFCSPEFVKLLQRAVSLYRSFRSRA